MSNIDLDKLNNVLSNKTLTWCGHFLGQVFDEHCYSFKIQVNKIKDMIVVGEWSETIFVNVTVLLETNNPIYQFISVIQDRNFDAGGILNKFSHLKHGLEKEIQKLIKSFGFKSVIVEDIKYVMVNTEKNITEGHIRDTVRDIIRNIIMDIKQDIKANKVTKFGPYNIGGSPITVQLKLNLTDSDKLLKPFDIDGDWDDNKQQINIDVDVDDSAGSEILYDLIGELNDIVVHELEHKKQYVNNYEFSDKEYTQPLRYYTQPHEIEAQLAGFKRKAKLQKKPLDDVMMDFFVKRKKKYNLSKNTIDKIINRIKSYDNR